MLERGQSSSVPQQHSSSSDHNNHDQFVRMRDRLVVFKVLVAAFMLVFGAVLVAIWTIYLALGGTFGYYWVLYIVLFHTSPFASAGVILLVLAYTPGMEASSCVTHMLRRRYLSRSLWSSASSLRPRFAAAQQPAREGASAGELAE